jgi:hypothetical protein
MTAEQRASINDSGYLVELDGQRDSKEQPPKQLDQPEIQEPAPCAWELQKHIGKTTRFGQGAVRRVDFGVA